MRSIRWRRRANDGPASSEAELNYHTFFEAYKARLERWNQTPRYRYELAQLIRRLKAGKRILDYGCGTGCAVEHFRNEGFDVYGYDRFRYVDGSPDWYRTSFPFLFDQVYFMHSFAHIDQAEDVLYKLRPMMNDGGEIIIITPNRVYLDHIVHTPGYQPDTTVVHHYDIAELVATVEAARWKVTERTYFGFEDPEERILIKATL